MQYIKEKNIGKSSFLAFMLIPLGGFATDIFLPSLPGMAAYLNVSQSAVQLMIILFMTSSGISQVFTGVILDSFGRFRINVVSLLAFALISFLVTVIPNIYAIYALRVFQGMAVSLIIVGKRAYFADVYSGNTLKHYTSLFSIVWSTAPIIAPFIGGYLEHHWGWKANFYFLALFTSVLLLFEWKYSGESLKVENRQPFQLRKIIGIYKTMLSTADFSLGLFIIGLDYSLQILYSISSPFLIEAQYRFSPVVTGYCALMFGVALMAGGLISRVMMRYSLVKKLLWGVSLQVALSVGMLLISVEWSNIYTLVGCSVAVNLVSGFLFNNVYSYCLRRFTSYAATASGLTGGGIYIISSIFNYSIIQLFNINSQLIYTFINLGLVFVMFWIIVLFLWKRKQYEVAME